MPLTSLSPGSALPEPTLRRLPWYLAHVRLLDAQGEEYVSSTRISQALSVDASQIAKDLSFLGIKGKTRIGYAVHSLCQALTDFLGFARSHRAVVVGCGSLGCALMRDLGLQQYGLDIVAGFDVSDTVCGTTVGDTPVMHISELDAWQGEHNADIAILAVPVEHSQAAADHAIGCGLRAIWNFTPVRIRVPRHIAIANTSIYAHLAIIYNRMATAPEMAPANK